jgi:hypothetical protein
MKPIGKLILLLTLLSLVSCTFTKRKYTGGYSINWHSKAPEAWVNKSALNNHTINKITQTNSSLVKAKVEPQTEKRVNPKIVPATHYASKERETTKTISATSTYTVTPEKKTPEQITSKKTTHGWKVALAIIFCILGVIGAIIVALLIASAPFWTGAALPLSQALSDALVPLLLLLASLLFSNMAMADGYNRGLIACIILDSILLLVLVFSVFS